MDRAVSKSFWHCRLSGTCTLFQEKGLNSKEEEKEGDGEGQNALQGVRCDRNSHKLDSTAYPCKLAPDN